MRIKVKHVWYDIWVGFYWDSKKRLLYFCPIPMLVFEIDFKKYETIPFSASIDLGERDQNSIIYSKEAIKSFGNQIDKFCFRINGKAIIDHDRVVQSVDVVSFDLVKKEDK